MPHKSGRKRFFKVFCFCRLTFCSVCGKILDPTREPFGSLFLSLDLLGLGLHLQPLGNQANSPGKQADNHEDEQQHWNVGTTTCKDNQGEDSGDASVLNHIPHGKRTSKSSSPLIGTKNNNTRTATCRQRQTFVHTTHTIDETRGVSILALTPLVD